MTTEREQAEQRLRRAIQETQTQYHAIMSGSGFYPVARFKALEVEIDEAINALVSAAWAEGAWET